MTKRGFLAVAIAWICAFTLTPAASAMQPNIVGGVNADQAYPFIVSFQSASGRPFCGGTLIKPTWIVTATHCVKGRGPKLFTARIGSNDHSAGGEVAEPAEVITHPNYDPSGSGGDIALVRLTNPVQAAPIDLSTSAVPGTKTRILGWGQTCAPESCGQEPKILQQLDTQIVDPSRCSAKFDTSFELCTDNPGGVAGSCYGDSGAPQLVKLGDRWRLVGVTSRPGNADSTCATAPSIYTSAVAYAPWITEKITTTQAVKG